MSTRLERRAQARQLARDSARQPETLTPVPESAWPAIPAGGTVPFAVWRSRRHLAMAYREKDGVIRLSVLRTKIKTDLHWDEGMDWDELQDVKRQAGFGNAFAVEIFPPERDVVNVANLRHLWILPAPLDLGWKTL